MLPLNSLPDWSHTMRFKTQTPYLICLTVVGLLCPTSHAQVASGAGSISGTITDSSGANVAGAAVSVIQVATQVTRTAVTDPEGRYYALSLAPGEYQVKVRMNGF